MWMNRQIILSQMRVYPSHNTHSGYILEHIQKYLTHLDSFSQWIFIKSHICKETKKIIFGNSPQNLKSQQTTIIAILVKTVGKCDKRLLGAKNTISTGFNPHKFMNRQTARNTVFWQIKEKYPKMLGVKKTMHRE